MHQSKLVIDTEEQEMLSRIHYNQNRMQLILIMLYEAAMIIKLLPFIAKKDRESLTPHLKAVWNSETMKELTEASEDLQNAFEIVRKKLGPTHSPDLERALNPVREQERRNISTLWLSLGRAEGLRFLGDLFDQYTLIAHGMKSGPAVTVRESGRNFWGPSDTSGKAKAFNYYLIYELFGAVTIYQDGSQNNAHYVAFTEEGRQWYLGIFSDALHLSKDFDDKNRGYFAKIRGFVETFFGSRRAVRGAIAGIAAAFALSPDIHAPDNAYIMTFENEARMAIFEEGIAGRASRIGKSTKSGQHDAIRFAEGPGTHRAGGGTTPLILTEGSGAHRVGGGTTPLIVTGS